MCFVYGFYHDTHTVVLLNCHAVIVVQSDKPISSFNK